MIKRIVSILPFLLVLSLTGAFVYYVTNSFDRIAIETNLRGIEPVFLLVNFLLILALFLLNFKDITKRLSEVNNRTWLILAVVFIIGLSLRTFATPHTHRVYFDEDIYLDMGKEILLRGQGSLCNYGDSSSCYAYAFMKWPNGYPFLLAVAYLFFGISETVAFALVTLLSSLSVVLIFLITYLLSGRERIALFASLMFALIPIHIMWSGTAATEPVLVFFTMLAAFFFALGLNSINWKMNLLALSTLAYAVQIRTEGIILLPIFFLLVLLLDKERWKKFVGYKSVTLWVLFFVLITPYLVHAYHSSINETWGSSEGTFGLKFAVENAPVNAWFWIAGYPTIEHPFLYTALAFIGIAYLARRDRKLLISLGSWFLLFFVLYAFFYAGSVLYGVDVRYALSSYVPFVMLAAFGSYALTRIEPRRESAVTILVSVIILVSFLFYLPSVATPAEKIEEARQARVYHDYVLDYVNNLDDDCYILSHVPSMYLAAGVNSLQTWFGQNEQIMKELFEKTDCVVFDDGFWCWVEPYKSSVCKHMFDEYELLNITSIKVDDKNYGLYYVERM